MTTPLQVPSPVPDGAVLPPPRRAIHWGRVVFGLLLAAAGVAWLVDALGTDVPWRFAPAIGLLVVGVALMLSVLGGTGRADLVVLGVVLAVIATLVGFGVDRYFAGPVGDVTITPAATEWPISRTVAAGTVEIDLTRAIPPAEGRMEVSLGAGKIILRAPESVAVDASVALGSVTVNGTKVREGADLTWTDESVGRSAPTVTVNVAVGEVEVHHGQS